MHRFFQIVSCFLVVCILMGNVFLPAAAQTAPKEFRAVWVSTIYGLDYPAQPTTNAASLKAQADSVLDHCKEMGMTAVILQVRPASDAFYPSRVFPWSKYLTGTQGTAPANGFDPLQYWVDEAHKRGLELHAWINPYRVANSQEEYDAMVAEHPAKKNVDWVVKHSDGKYYFNPGVPSARKLVVDGAKEIVDNYAIDGLHLDDYFYPDAAFADDDTFQAYGQAYENKDDWRRNNVNLLVQELASVVKQIGRPISFGVSPAGVWANKSSLLEGSDTRGNQTYFTHFADTRKWVKEEWIDYICPQLYWYIGNPAADYDILARWWAETVRGTKVKLYVGMADYQAGSAEQNSPWYGIGEIQKQVALNQTISEISGEVHFRYRTIVENSQLEAFYQQTYLPQENPPEENGKVQLDKTHHNAYMKGIDGAFLPQKELSRAEAATVLARLLVDANGQPVFDEKGRYPSDFRDVEAAAWYAPAVGLMTQSGILNGYEDGTFQPQKAITRAEFIALLSRFDKLEEGLKNTFPDVPAKHWAVEQINHGVKKGYLSGYEDGTFRPDQQISRAEAAKVINRVLGRTPDLIAIEQLKESMWFSDLDLTHWAFYEIMEATQTHTYLYLDGVERWTFG